MIMMMMKYQVHCGGNHGPTVVTYETFTHGIIWVTWLLMAMTWVTWVRQGYDIQM